MLYTRRLQGKFIGIRHRHSVSSSIILTELKLQKWKAQVIYLDCYTASYLPDPNGSDRCELAPESVTTPACSSLYAGAKTRTKPLDGTGHCEKEKNSLQDLVKWMELSVLFF